MGAFLQNCLTSPDEEEDIDTNPNSNFMIPSSEESRNVSSELVVSRSKSHHCPSSLTQNFIVDSVEDSVRPLTTGFQHDYQFFTWPYPELSQDVSYYHDSL